MLEIVGHNVEDRPSPIRARVEHRADERSQAPLGLVESSAGLGRIGHVARDRDEMIRILCCQGSKPISVARSIATRYPPRANRAATAIPRPGPTPATNTLPSVLIASS